MKKKTAVFVKILILAAIFILYILYLADNSNYMLAKRFFHMNVRQYEVIEVKNTMRPMSYDGKYEMTLQLGEEQFEALKDGGIFNEYHGAAESRFGFAYFLLSNGIPGRSHAEVRYEELENGSYQVKLIYEEVDPSIKDNEN